MAIVNIIATVRWYLRSGRVEFQFVESFHLNIKTNARLIQTKTLDVNFMRIASLKSVIL